MNGRTCLILSSVLASLALVPAALLTNPGVSRGEVAPAAPAEKPLDAATCLKCHTGKPVQPAEWSQTAHSAMSCTDCHGEVLPSHSKKDVSLPEPDCSMCHDVPGKGKKSIHMEARADGSPSTDSCTSCHADIHNAPRSVDCLSCHDDAGKSLEGSEHWKPAADGKEHRAGCTDCHSDVHEILPAGEPGSALDKVEVHLICAKCHDDPSRPATNPVTGDTFVPVGSYLTSVHGDKLGKVPHVATCTDCHGHHGFRRISDPTGTLSMGHIIDTCGKCHQGKVEKFWKGKHGEMLEAEIDKVSKMALEDYAKYVAATPYETRPPVCTSCHTSHSIQKASGKGGLDEVKALCGKCHGKEVEMLSASIHRTVVDPGTGEKREVRCQDCHLDYHENKDIRANDSIVNKRNMAEVCARCHDHEVKVKETGDVFEPLQSYEDSVHGKGVFESGLYFSAGCVDCHGSHSIFPIDDTRSSLHHQNVADTCGNANCHVGIHDKFLEGTHGKVFASERERYQKLPARIQATYDFRGPACIDCHISHSIRRTDDNRFFKDAIMQCGKCHEFAMATYMRSNHGKYALLGSPDVAKCYDCHGNHVNLTAAGSDAQLTPEILLERCRKCHKKATMEMVSYITHVSLGKDMPEGGSRGVDTITREKKKGEKVLGIVRGLMETLLASVFVFFGIHSLLWLVRGLAERFGKREGIPLELRTEYFQRLDPVHRVLHVFVVVSFLGLALTGLPIKYPAHPWAAAIFGVLDALFQGNGGQVARLFHRVFAMITFGYLSTHVIVLFVWSLGRRHGEAMARIGGCPVDTTLPPEARNASWWLSWTRWALMVALIYMPLRAYMGVTGIAGSGETVRSRLRKLVAFLFGPDSMAPRPQDLRDLIASFRWFLWLGPRPRWDRWTYYEKFDYMAVFWGVGVIGLTGLCIWFKEFFTATLGLPGWAINVAMEVHSHEALLATAFIFSIHFFNTHLNPGKFPMDRVIFTGRVNRHELMHERPALYERLAESGRLDSIRTSRAPVWIRVLGAIFGTVAVGTGITLVFWIMKMEWSHVLSGL